MWENFHGDSAVEGPASGCRRSPPLNRCAKGRRAGSGPVTWSPTRAVAHRAGESTHQVENFCCYIRLTKLVDTVQA